jgi:hypothetical protein
VNDRIQVFRKDGTFVKEFIIEKTTLRAGSVWDLDFWIDPQQTYLLNADGTNNEVRTLLRETGEIVGAFGRNGRNAGEFHWVHNLAVDSKGNIYTTEVDTGKRAQKFPLCRTGCAIVSERHAFLSERIRSRTATPECCLDVGLT